MGASSLSACRSAPQADDPPEASLLTGKELETVLCVRQFAAWLKKEHGRDCSYEQLFERLFPGDGARRVDATEFQQVVCAKGFPSSTGRIFQALSKANANCSDLKNGGMSSRDASATIGVSEFKVALQMADAQQKFAAETNHVAVCLDLPLHGPELETHPRPLAAPSLSSRAVTPRRAKPSEAEIVPPWLLTSRSRSSPSSSPSDKTPRPAIGSTLTMMQCRKLKPLLCALEAAKDSEMLNLAGLLDSWREAARRAHGILCDEDKALIELGTNLFSKALQSSARKKPEEEPKFSHRDLRLYLLGKYDDSYVHKMFRTKLRNAIAKEPSLVVEVIERLRTCDATGQALVTAEELQKRLTELSAMLSVQEDQASLALIAKDLVQALVGSPRGEANLWEAIAHILGRRVVPVELLLYDISGGVQRQVLSLLAGKHLEAVYHTAILAFGAEYWYSGRVIKTIPPTDQFFGEPLKASVMNLEPSHYKTDLHILRLGCTLLRSDEFEAYLNGILCKQYGPNKFDVFTNNCNCFSNSVAKFLAGRTIPDQVMKLPELIMDAPVMKLIRPVLNNWLGGYNS